MTDHDLEYVFVALEMIKAHAPKGPSRIRTIAALKAILRRHGWKVPR